MSVDPEKSEKILQALRAGNYAKTSYQYAGVSKSTYYRWLEEDPEFRIAVHQARAVAEVALIAQIRKAGQEGSWQALAWLLERGGHWSL